MGNDPNRVEISDSSLFPLPGALYKLYEATHFGWRRSEGKFDLIGVKMITKESNHVKTLEPAIYYVAAENRGARLTTVRKRNVVTEQPAISF